MISHKKHPPNAMCGPRQHDGSKSHSRPILRGDAEEIYNVKAVSKGIEPIF